MCDSNNGIVLYEHHGLQVYAIETLAGLHWQHCLCYRCGRFSRDNEAENCPIANDLYRLCVQHGLAAPVYECPNFRPAAACGEME